jgi:cysteine desulfurase / selenocysteine lyase
MSNVTLNFTKLREDFPILKQLIRGKPLIYFDSAATTQKPKAVLAAMEYYYTHDNSNVHRGLHTLAARADKDYEKARETVRKFINAHSLSEIIFTHGATDAINLVAHSYVLSNLKAGDKILLSAMEHHSNIVPWQLAGKIFGTQIEVVPISAQGEIDLESYARLLQLEPKLVAITQVSNVLGTVNPIKKMVAMAHAVGAKVLVDGAQAVGHMAVDVQDLDCDFYVFSGHKMYGPTGVGVLYGKVDLLEKMPPYQSGGGMIKSVSFAETRYADLPAKFEAGTPAIAEAVGLATAIDYLQALTFAAISKHEEDLINYTLKALSEIPDLTIIGTAKEHTGLVSFVFNKIHPHDVGTILDTEGIAVRAGHHCAMPLMDFFNIPATVRISFGVYNTLQEVDVLIQSITKIKRIFQNG